MTRLLHSPSPRRDLHGGEPPGRDLSPQPLPVRGTSFESAASSPADTEPRTIDPSSPIVRGDCSVRFSHSGEHEAMHAAEAWCKARGFSVGTLQADAPRGILYGSYAIAKWRNLDGEDRADLHGFMDAPGRTWRKGPVTIQIRRDAPAAVLEAFRSDPEPSTPLANLERVIEARRRDIVASAPSEQVDRLAMDQIEGRR